MQLTQLRPNPHNPQARRDLADPYEMHRTLVRAFVHDEKESPPRVLWRLEPGQSWSQPVVLVQSEQPGDWSFLNDIPGYLGGGGLPPPTKEFDPNALVRAGAPLRFRLCANPTVTRQGKRLGLVGEDAQLAWLQRQGVRLGFHLQTALVSGSDMVRGRRGNATVSFRQVLFEGVLEVGDADLLAGAVVNGIGHGKAFGCGLLSLARAG
ncbi:CRISPR system Cascade subunit CasE [Roseateles asaccharophilus]|uniref:type I-E CRISPR-associated protein Cas6/Cse3/CasE n=1 Tax=Roseateles asaccharophilus TaxID=582607 RepID=UPI003837E47A